VSERLQFGELTFEIRRSTRRATLGLTVDRDGDLIVHAPDTAELADVQRWVKSKLLWVHRKLAAKESSRERLREPEFVSGENFTYLGQTYRLKLVAEAAEPLVLEGGWFRLRADAREVAPAIFRQWYIATGRDWLLERAATVLARRVGTWPSAVDVRDLGYRWGSCTKSGNLLFNWRLLQLPVRLVDYVIVHELTHLGIPNHGREFWRAVERALPDWRVRKGEFEGGALNCLVFGVLPAASNPCMAHAEE
jgi:predicted metal-dependent hydrolase